MEKPKGLESEEHRRQTRGNQVSGVGASPSLQDTKERLNERTSRRTYRSDTDGFFQDALWLDFYHVPSGQEIEFKAFLTNFEDNYDSSWNEEEVYGRNDPLLTFEGTSRSISLGWVVRASHPAEAYNNMKRVSSLINFLYPHYDVSSDSEESVSATSISAAPLLKIRMMNWVQDVSSADFNGNSKDRAKNTGLLGKPDGITFSPELDQGVYWGSDLDTLEERESADSMIGTTDPYKMYPKEFELSMEFVVNHQHDLGWSRETPRQEGFPYGEELQDGEFMVVSNDGTDGGDKPSNNQEGQSKQNDVKKNSNGGGGGGGAEPIGGYPR